VAVSRPRPRSTRLLVLGLVSASLAIITLDYRQGADGPLAAVGAEAQQVMAPMQKAVTTVTDPVGDFLSGVANLPSLQDENERLTEELAQARTIVAGTAELREQNQRLQDLLGLKATLDPTGVPAVVIASGVSNFDWTVTIDAGSNDGVEVDMPVVAGTASAPRLVGIVVAVNELSSEVQLLIDRDFRVAGVLSSSRETGLVAGQGDQDLRMELITPGTEIDLEAGAVEVFTVSYELKNGQRGLYPPGILVGSVSRVFEGSNDIQTAVSVRPAVDFSALEYVLVLRTQTEEGDAG
jgi:rod shape-determining protein MreC